MKLFYKIIYIILVGISISLFACNSHEIKDNANEELHMNSKVTAFLSGESSGNGTRYISREADSLVNVGQYPSYIYMREINDIIGDNSKEPEKLFLAVQKLFDIIRDEASKESLSTIQKIELQNLTHIAINSGLENAEIEKDKKFAVLLNKALLYTSPIEWNYLTKAFVYAQTALSAEEKTYIKAYLINGMERTIKDGILNNKESNERIVNAAREALPVVRSL